MSECCEDTEGATHVSETESWLIGFVHPIHLHHSIVPSHQDLGHAAASHITGGQTADATILLLIQHVPAIARLRLHQLYQAHLAVLSAVEHLLTVFTCDGGRRGLASPMINTTTQPLQLTPIWPIHGNTEWGASHFHLIQ